MPFLSRLLALLPSRRRLPKRLLREYLLESAARREAAIATVLATIGVLSCTWIILLTPLLGRGLVIRLVGIVGALSVYYSVLSVALRRGWFHPAVLWVNTAIEVSIPAVILVLDFWRKGALYAMTAPPVVIWSGLITLSALRFRPALVLGAGILVAVEYLTLYFGLLRPNLEADLLSLTPPFIALRAFFLLSAGIIAATLAHHYTKEAERALADVRARDLFGKYILHERIGSGGMAEVYRATYCPEGGFEKTVAIKRIRSERTNKAELIELFRFEARLGALLNHPNVVQVLDFGRHGRSYYLTMEYVEGRSLAALMSPAGGRLPLAAVTYIGAELAAALDYIHSRRDQAGKAMGLVHRDLNPPNVLISRLGEVKLSDFGIAWVSGRPDLTAPGAIRGKTGYLAPEQVREARASNRSDLFSLGIILYEMISGKRFFSDLRDVLVFCNSAVAVPPPSAGRADTPAALEQLVMELLARDPSARPASGRLVRDRLLALDGPSAPYPAGQNVLAETVVEAEAADLAASSTDPHHA